MLRSQAPIGWIDCVAYGLRMARAHWRLVVALWLVFLGSALLAWTPANHWWHDALAPSPAADALLERFDLTLAVEAMRDGGGGRAFVPVILAPVIGVVMLMLALNPFVAGGTLAVVSWPDRVPGRFFDGGRRFYWRFVKLFAMVLVAAGVLIAGGVLLTSLAFDAAWHSGRETLAWAISATAVVLGVGLWIACILALDYARIHVVCLDPPRARDACRAAMPFVIGHLWSVLALALTFGVLTFALVVLSHPLDRAWPASNALLIWLGVGLHQALALARVWLRVAWLAGALHLTRARHSFDLTLIA